MSNPAQEQYLRDTMREFLELLDRSTEDEVWIYGHVCIAKLSEQHRLQIFQVLQRLANGLATKGIPPGCVADLENWRSCV